MLNFNLLRHCKVVGLLVICRQAAIQSASLSFFNTMLIIFLRLTGQTTCRRIGNYLDDVSHTCLRQVDLRASVRVLPLISARVRKQHKYHRFQALLQVVCLKGLKALIVTERLLEVWETIVKVRWQVSWQSTHSPHFFIVHFADRIKK